MFSTSAFGGMFVRMCVVFAHSVVLLGSTSSWDCVTLHHSALDGRLGGFSLLVLIVRAAVTILAAVCWGTPPRVSLACTRGSDIIGAQRSHYISSFATNQIVRKVPPVYALLLVGGSSCGPFLLFSSCQNYHPSQLSLWKPFSLPNDMT